jgi:hypothetical protein
MPHPSTNHLISRVRDFCRWQEKLFGDPSAQGVPVEDPPGWATEKEFWIRNNVWRDTIFEGNADDSMAAADALIERGVVTPEADAALHQIVMSACVRKMEGHRCSPGTAQPSCRR